MRRDVQLRRWPARGCRGFDLVQLVVVVALLGVLTAVTFAAFISPVEEVSRAYLRNTLVSVDMEVRQRVRAAQTADVGWVVEQVVGTDGALGCPQGGVVPIVTSECAEGRDDDGVWLEVDEWDGQVRVVFAHSGRCEQLLVDADGGAGTVGPCADS